MLCNMDMLAEAAEHFATERGRRFSCNASLELCLIVPQQPSTQQLYILRHDLY